MKKYSLVLCFLCLSMMTALAQRTVEGTITSAEDNLPVIGANVLIEGTAKGTITDVDGNFSLEIPDDDAVLVFSYTGYESQKIRVGSQSRIDVTLNVNSELLDEVVVIGYGTQKKSVVTGAIASVSAEEIQQTPVLRVEQALQGRTAGVQVTSSSGQPGAGITVRIRGAGTTGNADPLYVVDGLPVGGIDYLNPGDIESIEVLKDAASTAIYGARAANGVVLITTKSGSQGSLQVSYDGYYGIQNPWRQIAMANAREYAILRNEANAASGLSPVFDNPESLGEGTFWQDAVFNADAPIQNHNVSVTGGNEKSNYAASFSYFSQEGIVGNGEKSRYDRYTARINSTHKVSGRLTFGQNFSYSRIEPRGIDPNSEFGGILSNSLNIDPTTPVFATDPAVIASYDPRAVRDENGNVYAISPYATQEVVNPLARLEVTNSNFILDKIVGNVYAELEIIQNLKVKTDFGIDLAYGVSNNFRPEFFLNAAQISNESRVDKSMNRWRTWNWENTISYSRQLGDHNLSLLVGTTANDFKNVNFAAGKSGLVFTNFENAFLNTATNEESATANGGAFEIALLSYFGRFNYNYRDKYLFTAVFRRDGSSQFGQNSRFGSFPAFSAGWVISEEAFMDNLPFVDFLKLRASWGQNGNNQIGAYSWASTIFTGAGYTFGDGSTFTSGAVPSAVPNPDLEWETSEQTNIGLDLRFLEGRLSVTTDYYVKETQGLLIQAPIPGIVGNNPPVVNGGNVENRGWEFAIGYRNKVSDFNYDVNFNISYNENEVTAINNAQGVIVGAGFSTYGAVSRAAVGFPIGYFWGLQTNGIFQNEGEVESYTRDGVLIQPDASPGDLRFVDLNQDGTINDEDRTIIGNPTPDWTYGFNVGGDYKGFDFSVFIQGAIGNEIFNGTRRHDLTSSNFPARFLNRWTGEGSTNEIPRIIASDPNGNFSKISDFYIEDGSFLRLKDLQVGYTLPQQALDFMGLTKFRIYVAAQNLLTITDYNGFDPEIGARSALDIGIDRGIYPQPRSYRLGVNVIF